MLMAQISERRELNAVFADLFDSDGNEVYLKRAACFALLGRTTPVARRCRRWPASAARWPSAT